MGAVWGDYDNDGYEDLFLIKWGKPELFHNDQGHGFTQVSDECRLTTLDQYQQAPSGLTMTATGGWICSLAGTTPKSWIYGIWIPRSMMPESFEYAKNGGRKFLFHNLGNGKFEEVSEKAGITSSRWALAASAADLRGTGHPDLFIANDYGVSELFLNEGGHFHEAGQATGVGFAPKKRNERFRWETS